MPLVTAALALCLTGCAADAAPEDARLPMPSPVTENAAFADWLTAFRADAMKAGISGETFDRSLAGVRIDRDVIEANEAQPEFTKPVWEYLEGALSDTRVAKGRALLAENKALLDRIEARYGVDRHVLVAIWGLESNYGSFQGTMSVVRSLATLGFEGRRTEYGRTQLIAALEIIQHGDVAPKEMTGSWAGAMGQTQFIPTTYNAHAVDFDGDGRRDIWKSHADALASAAHYLDQSGWKTGAVWGHEVKLPKDFDYSQADMSIRKSVAEWVKTGVARIDGRSFPGGEMDEKASVFLPSGHRGPAFLVMENFRTVLAYNASTSYSLAVNLLADRFKGRGEIAGAWPRGDRPLGRHERHELQRLLTAKGHDTGGVDGIIGYNTRKAVRAYQASIGLPADGYPTHELLQRLKKN
ncbi:MAG: murein transglycosylase [Parvibaculum sp.]|jgi:membrane-bound lytic murein transglycosylase B|nr:murein transglycosylase [Parvibaculum sp.]MBO6667996.1 lytic murein transglycosylase [Parvibaculum sp.]MBO6690609.1 lytic murein transglycosylase [Parvibaculum sp.]MBO6714768.1 lytic murein transglycosylase [Parvibaculum sp.]HAC58840.1 lytic murein transglycosylase [Rhodobiaceae bacterium]